MYSYLNTVLQNRKRFNVCGTEALSIFLRRMNHLNRLSDIAREFKINHIDISLIIIFNHILNHIFDNFRNM